MERSHEVHVLIRDKQVELVGGVGHETVERLQAERYRQLLVLVRNMATMAALVGRGQTRPSRARSSHGRPRIVA